MGRERATEPLILYAFTIAGHGLAGDLWVETLNAHPHGLSDLDGERRRIQELADKSLADARKPKPAGDEPSAKEQDEMQDGADDEAAEDEKGQAAKPDPGKMIAIKAIHNATKGSYNLSQSMGDLLRGKMDFTSVQGIREAYSLAFRQRKQKKAFRSMVAAVDAALSDTAIDALAAVRHVIVHKAGTVDESYRRDHRKLPAALRVKAGQVPLDGDNVKNLIEPVAACSVKLLTAIDGWLSRKTPA